MYPAIGLVLAGAKSIKLDLKNKINGFLTLKKTIIFIG